MISLKTDVPFLFLSLDDMESSNGTMLCLGQAEKYKGNPLVRVGKVDAPDALQVGWHFSVLFDPKDQLFKIWYSATGHMRTLPFHTAYAYSENGIEWIKPKLGLFEYNGNKNNNLVFLHGGKGQTLHAIFIDPEEADPQQRFKTLLGYVTDVGAKTVFAKKLVTSPDGIHWTVQDGPQILESELPIDIDADGCGRSMHWIDVNQVMYDASERNPEYRYKFYGQSYSKKTPGSRSHRNISIATAPRFGRVATYEKNPILDIEREEEIHFCTVYRTESYYIMFHEFAFYEPVDQRYTGDIRLSVSRDGFNFQRLFPRQAIVKRGDVGQWDGCALIAPNEIIEKDDKLWIYYSGSTERWNNWPGRVPKGFPLSAGEVQSSEIGLAWMRPDGFTYMTCEDEILPGELTTVPMTVPRMEGIRMVVGTDNTLTRRNWLEAEIMDALTNEPVQGFTKSESIPCIQDGLRVPLRWNHKSGIDELAGRSIKIKFYLFGKVKLYSFRVIRAVDGC